jgi:hypothetical protein
MTANKSGATMQATSNDCREETIAVPVEYVGTFAGSRVCRVIIDGEETQLKIPKGMRGVKVGAMLTVRIEYRSWFNMTRMVFNLREGTSSESSERVEYHDGAEHAHPFIVGVAKV